MSRTAVYFFCRTDADPVASRVLDVLVKLHAPAEVDVVVDGEPVLEHGDGAGNRFLFVRTDDVLSHDYPRYLPVLNEHFADADFAAVVNWHEGANAPDRVITVHSTGDVPTGYWSPADPGAMRNLMRAFDTERQAAGLDDFAVVTEATHWSGVPYGGTPDLIPQYAVPTYDIEIGSSPEAWGEAAAHEVVAHGLTQVFAADDQSAQTVLCAGGVHVETAWSTPVLDGAYAVGHHLPNQWLVTGEYDQPSADDKLDACVASIRGGVQVIAVHDKLKATYKEPFRRLAERLGVPVVKHQALRRSA
ncbi:MAG TPA: D-aminoacyl-tRNA deacylase [Acidimicrobiales bacterium]|nr:D-aminoacyl-tRNA deacylase [Acidimicrobiales bacterium]